MFIYIFFLILIVSFSLVSLLFCFKHSCIVRVITKSDDRSAGVRFVYLECDNRPNFYQLIMQIKFLWEKKNSQVVKERENLY